MSLTLPTTGYDDQVKLGNIVENWIMQLGYDDFPGTSTDFIGVSLHPTTISSVYYHGVVQKSPTIRNSMNLANSTAKSGNVTLQLNNIQYKGDDLSAELFGGTRKYINRVVKIYSCMPGATALTDCLQVANLRLENIQHNDNTITLSLVEARPWDFISLPSTILRNEIYEPVAYGTFTSNDTTEGTPTYCTAFTQRPVPVIAYSNNNVFCSIGAADVTTGAGLHYYDKAENRLVNVTSSQTNSQNLFDTYTIRIPDEVRYPFIFKPISTNDSSDVPEATARAAYDFPLADDLTTGATLTKTSGVLSDGDNDFTLILDMPAIDQEAVAGFAVDIAWEVHITSAIGANSGVTILNNVGSVLQSGAGGSNITTTSESSDPLGSTTYSGVKTTTTPTSGTYTFTFRFHKASGGACNGYCRIEDFRISTIAHIDHSDEIAGKRALENIKLFYTGADGLDLDITGEGGSVTEIHEAHLDMLNRFAGFDVDTDPATDITNWTALNTAKNWAIRWWKLDPVNLRKTLEQMQFEGGFIFKWRADGSGSYWFVEDDYTDGTDEAATLTEKDVRNLKVSNSPFSELLTKMNINYEKHPAKSGYLTTVSPYADTARTDWNIQAKENIAEVNLDAYVSPAITAYDNSTDVDDADANDDFFSYYYEIFGNVKLIVECDIINPKYYNLETGDVIQFNYSLVDPFGKSWTTPLWFMITDLTRSVGVMKIKCREVHSG